jgi:nucleoside-diphosphate-sugar epimerase
LSGVHVVFVAGAAGVIGKPLVTLLVQGGHRVFGTTRSKTRAEALERSGVIPIVLDVFDRQALADAIKGACPDVVIHQLTDLSGGLQPERIAETRAKTSRIRMEGTQNLVAAARASGVRRLIAQSIAWVYASGPLPHREDDPLDRADDGPQAVTARGIIALEEAVLGAAPVEGVVLRYGRFYGGGADASAPAGVPGVHVDAAAHAAVLAIERGAPGVYNVAEPSPALAIDKARRELGWDPSFRAG